MPEKDENRQIIKITDDNGLEREAEVLLFFKLKENGKEYIIYTFNEPAGEDLVTIHASTVKENQDGSFEFLGIDDEAEWTKVKDVMREVIKNSKE